MTEFETYFDELQQRLSLKWRVVISYINVNAPKIMSRKELQIHQIALPYPGRGRSHKADYANVLILAKFAEDLDPIFSKPYFAGKYNLYEPRFKDQVSMVKVAHQGVNIWATDKLYELDPQTAIDDARSTLTLIQALDKEVAKEIDIMALLFGLSLACAFIYRHALDQHRGMVAEVFVKVRQLWGKNVQSKFILLSTEFAKFPLLPENRDEALYLLEKSTQEIAKLMRFPIYPQIIEEKGRMVWIVD